MLVIDASMLILLLSPESGSPRGPDGKSVPHVKERVQNLIADLERTNERLVVPTPSLSESLVRRGLDRSEQLIREISANAVFSIEPFDARAAIELADLLRTESHNEQKKARRGGKVTYAKLKFDRQILAIAKVLGARAIYTDDMDLRSLCRRHGITPIGVAEIPLPADMAQRSFQLDGA